MPHSRNPHADAAEALLAVAPLASRWLERLLAQHEPPITVSQYLALRAISREPLTGSVLARRTGVSGPAVSQLLTGLSTTGLVERHPNPEDRRHQTLALSAGGVSVFESAHAMLTANFVTLLADLPHPEADAISRALPNVEAALAGTTPPRRPPPPPRIPVASPHRPRR